MAAAFRLSILTPERTVFDGNVEYLEAPGTEGYFGVLAHHAPLVSGLAEGTLKVRHVGGVEDRWKVAGGFFEVSDNKATVLADAISGGPTAQIRS